MAKSKAVYIQQLITLRDVMKQEIRKLINGEHTMQQADDAIAEKLEELMNDDANSQS